MPSEGDGKGDAPARSAPPNRLASIDRTGDVDAGESAEVERVRGVEGDLGRLGELGAFVNDEPSTSSKLSAFFRALGVSTLSHSRSWALSALLLLLRVPSTGLEAAAL